MTISKARRIFNNLKIAILQDEKVDFDETSILLDFIAPYVRAKNKKFLEFEKLLRKYREDDVITDEESANLIAEIDSISEFLKTEAAIESFVFGSIGIFISSVFCYFILKNVLHFL